MQPATASQDGRVLAIIHRNGGIREMVEQWSLFLHFPCIAQTHWLAPRRLEAAIQCKIILFSCDYFMKESTGLREPENKKQKRPLLIYSNRVPGVEPGPADTYSFWLVQ
jgi:hypothetical protein